MSQAHPAQNCGTPSREMTFGQLQTAGPSSRLTVRTAAGRWKSKTGPPAGSRIAPCTCRFVAIPTANQGTAQKRPVPRRP